MITLLVSALTTSLSPITLTALEALVVLPSEARPSQSISGIEMPVVVRKLLSVAMSLPPSVY